MRQFRQGVIIVQNHDAKPCDIARSVLPSTLSVGHHRRLIRKAERARARASLHTTDVDDGVFSDRVDRASRRDIREMVQDRRDGDHSSQLIRWARHHTNHDHNLIHATHQDRLQHFASVLPNNLAGRHALTHIAVALRHRRNLANNARDERQRHIASVHAAVFVILGAGCHAELNRGIRRAAEITKGVGFVRSDDRPRLLLGSTTPPRSHKRPRTSFKVASRSSSRTNSTTIAKRSEPAVHSEILASGRWSLGHTSRSDC